jgi:hypothetical protein
MSEAFYPVLLVCGLVGLMLLVGVVASYLWLVALDAQGRKCPNCGKRAAGKHLSSEIMDTTSHTTWTRPRAFGLSRPRLLEVTEKNYEDQYECRYCGHKWTKTGKETSRTFVSRQGKVRE